MTEADREAAFQRAFALFGRGEHAQAAEILEDLTRPTLTLKVAATLGAARLSLRQADDAAKWLGLAAGHRPGDPIIRSNLARALALLERTAEAEREYRATLAANPDYAPAMLGLAHLLLAEGRYLEGWPLLEARAALNPDTVPPVEAPFPEWRGEPLDGKSVLVWYEQGFGDQIQMCRFAASLKAQGAAHVALGARPPLVDLFRTLAAADQIIPVPRGAEVEVGAFDYWTRYMSLPHRLGVTLESLATAPYLHAPPERRERWQGLSGVGLAWRASPTGFNGRNKSLPPEQARRLLDLGCVSLDPEDTGAADFADTAAMIEQLELVISIDSAPAHLAGAMGKPVWTLLPAIDVDWRWLKERLDSPWYPTMRLYRQSEDGGWGEMVDRVVSDLGMRAI